MDSLEETASFSTELSPQETIRNDQQKRIVSSIEENRKRLDEEAVDYSTKRPQLELSPSKSLTIVSSTSLNDVSALFCCEKLVFIMFTKQLFFSLFHWPSSILLFSLWDCSFYWDSSTPWTLSICIFFCCCLWACSFIFSTNSVVLYLLFFHTND